MSNISDVLKNIEYDSKHCSWTERFARSLATNKKEKQTMVHPCVIDGVRSLVYERGLQESAPVSYQSIVEFAKTNNYQLKEDQRANFIDGIKRVKNKHRANAVTIMVLTATLLSTNVAAKTIMESAEINIDREVTQSQAIKGFDLNFDTNTSQEELVAGLLGWINNHSIFDHSIDDMPDIVKVSAVEMANVAFGGDLPQAVDPEKLQIYGLYNFNERAVYILDSLDLESEEGKGILLHELVHFLQYQYDQDENIKCKNELESLAYLLEGQYLKSLDHVQKINMSHINRVSQCK